MVWPNAQYLDPDAPGSSHVCQKGGVTANGLCPFGPSERRKPATLP